MNILDGLESGQIARSDFDRFSQAVATTFDWNDLKGHYEAVKQAAFCANPSLKFRHTAPRRPIEVPFCSVRTLGGLGLFVEALAMLSELDDDEQAVLDACSGSDPPEDSICEALADAINRHAEAAALVFGLPHRLFWVTQHQAASDAVRELEPSRHAEATRNLLGLYHLDPIIEPLHEPIFLFVSTEAAVGGGVEGAQPTAFDGIDNPRFCQLAERLAPCTLPEGWGAATDLRGEDDFGVGLPEQVTGDLPVSGNLRCLYLGRASSQPYGTDGGFMKRLLTPGRSLDDVAKAFGIRRPD